MDCQLNWNRRNTAFIALLSALLTASCSPVVTQPQRFQAERIQVGRSGDGNQNVNSALAGDWILQVENLERNPLIEIRLRFTSVSAESCIGGSWDKIEVLSEKSFIENDFLVDNELSYHIAGDTLVIGRNLVCDAYLRLESEFKPKAMSGGYQQLGHGGTQELGFFILKAASD